MAVNTQKQTKSNKVTWNPDTKFSPQTITALEDLFDFVPPRKLSIKLRTILLTYIRHEREMLPLDIDQTIMELELLMEFLDSIGESHHKKDLLRQSLNNKKP